MSEGDRLAERRAIALQLGALTLEVVLQQLDDVAIGIAQVAEIADVAELPWLTHFDVTPAQAAVREVEVLQGHADLPVATGGTAGVETTRCPGDVATHQMQQSILTLRLGAEGEPRRCGATVGSTPDVEAQVLLIEPDRPLQVSARQAVHRDRHLSALRRRRTEGGSPAAIFHGARKLAKCSQSREFGHTAGRPGPHQGSRARGC